MHGLNMKWKKENNKELDMGMGSQNGSCAIMLLWLVKLQVQSNLKWIYAVRGQQMLKWNVRGHNERYSSSSVVSDSLKMVYRDAEKYFLFDHRIFD